MSAVHRSIAAVALLCLTAEVFSNPAYSAGDDESPVRPAWSDQQPLSSRLADLESRIDRLNATPEERWLTEQRAAEIRGLIADVLTDADRRASLAKDRITGGHDGDFFIQSADGDFRVELSGQLQVRYVFNHQNGDVIDNDRYGIEIRRLKLGIDGNILGHVLGFSTTVALDQSTGDFRMQDSSVSFRMSEGLTFRVGRARPPLLREEAVSSKRQLLVERSLVAKAYPQDRALGASLFFQRDNTRIRAGISDNSDGLTADQKWTYSARWEQLLIGKWKGMEGFTCFPGEDPMIALGAGALLQNVDLDGPSQVDTKQFRWTTDLSIEYKGMNAFAAIVGNHKITENQDQIDQYGVVVQGGFFITERVELFAQYQSGNEGVGKPDLSVGTVGFNYYITRHDLKWTTDLGYGFNEVTSFWSSTSSGWRTDRRGEDGQIVFRTQFQLLF